MKTTIHNINMAQGSIKVVLFIEGNNQVAHIFKNQQLVSKLKYEKDQDIDINLIDAIRSDCSHEQTQ